MRSNNNLSDLRNNLAVNQKQGVHFIISSVLIWILILIIHSLRISMETKNILTFMVSPFLFPLSIQISKKIGVNFFDKENPLTSLGITLSMAQLPLILIQMWVFYENPDYVLMIICMTFGAHLLSFAWLYKSKAYLFMSIFVPLLSLLIGTNYPTVYLCLYMITNEIVFVILLYNEYSKKQKECNYEM